MFLRLRVCLAIFCNSSPETLGRSHLVSLLAYGRGKRAHVSSPVCLWLAACLPVCLCLCLSVSLSVFMCLHLLAPCSWANKTVHKNVRHAVSQRIDAGLGPRHLAATVRIQCGSNAEPVRNQCETPVRNLPNIEKTN